MLVKKRYLSIVLAMSSAFISCASDEYEQMDEQFAEEEMEQEDQEEVVEEEEEISTADEDQMTEADTDAVSETSEPVETVMQEPATETSSEALAAELDKLTAPSSSLVSDEESSDMGSSAGMETMGTDSTAMPENSFTTMQAPMVDAEQAEYIVQPGDTLGKIAGLVYGSTARWSELASDNGVMDPSVIYPGDVLKYRVEARSQSFRDAYNSVTEDVVTVQKGDTLTSIAERLFGRKDFWKPIWHLNRDMVPDPNRIEEGQMIKYIDPKKLTQTLAENGLEYAH